jgi:hypothetical protein
MSELWRRLRVLFRRDCLDGDLEAEMRAHPEMSAEDQQASGLDPTDPATFAAAALGLACIALLARYLPVRRAARGDALAAIRHE